MFDRLGSNASTKLATQVIQYISQSALQLHICLEQVTCLESERAFHDICLPNLHLGLTGQEPGLAPGLVLNLQNSISEAGSCRLSS